MRPYAQLGATGKVQRMIGVLLFSYFSTFYLHGSPELIQKREHVVDD